ncbi:N-acetyltransferase family protein [Nocardia sp. CA-128927]|uniref:GNAT family N-acetyltransferase n=1 Tax=Nocardia sp. CA-128927 TaxID=3239975 RepID=UPI003D952E73
MRDLVIRTAGAGDLLAVLAIHEPLESDGASPRVASDLQQRTWAHMMQRSDDLTVYLAEVGGEPVGTATQLLLPHVTYDCAPTAFIEAVVVDPEHRRKGIARAMMRRLLSDARAAGCNKVQLLSHKRHATDGAHRLYMSLGFEPEAEGFRLYLQRVPAAVQAAKVAAAVKPTPGLGD